MKAILIAAALLFFASEAQAVNIMGYNPYSMQNNVNNAYQNSFQRGNYRRPVTRRFNRRSYSRGYGGGYGGSYAETYGEQQQRFQLERMNQTLQWMEFNQLMNAR